MGAVAPGDANLLLGAELRKRIKSAKRRGLVEAASTFRIEVDREPVSIAVFDDLAARHSLGAYDAAYLEFGDPPTLAARDTRRSADGRHGDCRRIEPLEQMALLAARAQSVQFLDRHLARPGN